MKKYLVGGVEMTSQLIVGAGVCKHPDALGRFMRTDLPIGAVVTGSYTPELRVGNVGVTTWPVTIEEIARHGAALNSMGMPNMGNAAAAKELIKLRPKLIIPFVASIAGFNVPDYMDGIVSFDLDSNCGASAIEVNLGCPNTQDQHPLPISCSIDRTREIMSAIAETGPKVPIWVKLSPCLTLAGWSSLSYLYPEFDFSDVPTFEEGFDLKIIELVARYPFVRAVVLNNTLPNVRRVENGQPVTTPNNGKAGMSGPAMVPITHKSVIRATSMLSDTDIDVIASGGIVNGDLAAQMLELGAAAVACTSGPVWSGPRFFADMLQSERLQDFLTRNA